MRIDGLNMPLLRSWNLFEADFYKDVTPTAFNVCRAPMTSETVIHHVFNGTDDGNLFTHSSRLVAAHPVAHHLVHQSGLLKWLLWREAFLRFGFDPMRVFIKP